MRHRAPLVAALVSVLSCASVPSTGLARGSHAAFVPQSACPVIRDADPLALQRASDDAIRTLAPVFDRLFADSGVPASAAIRPPPDPPVLIKVKLPPGGLHANTITSIVWQDRDGAWWYWWRNVGGQPPAMPVLQDGHPVYPEEDAPRMGRLSAERAEAIEAALQDPCRNHDPDWWPWAVRLKTGGELSCVPDGSAYFAELRIAGQPVRRIGADCINITPTFRLIEAAAYAGDGPVDAP